MATHTALVTGGNRGIGLETARLLARRGLRVVLGVREAAAGEAAVQALKDEKLRVGMVALDVADKASVEAAVLQLARRNLRIDVLVNNAGIYPEGDALAAADEAFEDAFRVNALGALWTSRALLPEMLARGYGRIVNVSSGYASFARGLAGPAAYCVSKAALNAVTLKLAQLAHGDVKINAVDPGWVRTRMGGPAADLTPEAAAEGVVWAATLPAKGPNGGFFHQGKPAQW